MNLMGLESQKRIVKARRCSSDVRGNTSAALALAVGFSDTAVQGLRSG